ncbi:MAG: acyltransferase [Candidatus Krumholzibacteriota bacterium]|nr:acyltransferase [Candidatus Krumholzibacteriota bacterium]
MRTVHDMARRLYRAFFRYDQVRELKKNGFRAGKNLKILRDVEIDFSHAWHIEIGDDVTLAPRVQILAHDASTKTHLDYTRIGKVKIGDRVFIGASSIILPGVTIGSDVVIGAGSVVTGNIPDGQVVAGNPARAICAIDQFLRRKEDEMAACPTFGEEYTMRKNVSSEMKAEMNRRMTGGIGYIV